MTARRATNPTGRSRAARRLRRLGVLAGLVGAVAAIRRTLLDRDQRGFDARYGGETSGTARGSEAVSPAEDPAHP